jgi:hypothetical protein
MTSEEFAAYCRRIRLTNDRSALARIRAELDRVYPYDINSTDSDALVKMVTLKQLR